MKELFNLAEKEMIKLHQPYVGTEHFMLAYFKVYDNNILSYDNFLKFVKNIGYAKKASAYILYTPKLRYIKNNFHKVKDAIKCILKDEDSIAYNILLCNGININKLYSSIAVN